MRSLWMLLLGLGLLSGCTGFEIRQGDVDAETARADARAACEKSRADRETARASMAEGMSETSKLSILLVDGMVRQAEALSGKNPCDTGMNVHEARVAVAKSQNETVQVVGKPAVAAAGAVGTVAVVADAAKDVAAKIGDKIDAKEGSTISVEKTTSHSTTSIDSKDSTVSTTGSATHGTDKSQHETIHEAPAATPVAEESTSEEPEVSTKE